MVVRTVLKGLRNFYLVDSGAERIVSSRRVAARLNLELSRPLRLEPLAGIGLSLPIPVVRFERIPVGASIIRRLEASMYDLPAIIRADGLLGLPSLRSFRLMFEFDKCTLVLCQRS